MKLVTMAAVAILLGSGCRHEPPEPPKAAQKIDGLSLVVGCQAILYDPDPSETTVFAWKADRKHFASPEVGTAVLFLGQLPPRGVGRPAEARVKVLDGEERDSLLFVPVSNVKPAGPISGPYSP